ncbi:alpha/beta hydrolase [Microbacterium sp. gxy059]
MGWRPDLLGEGFEQLTLPLGADDEGEVVATLVRSLPHRSALPWRRGPYDGLDVLYVHGWSDYFFQTQLARFYTERGARFFALDLRKYGRSLRPGQTAGYVTDLATYDEDLVAALSEIGYAVDGGPGADPSRRLLLLGHSTGGLVLTLWAHRHPGVAAGLLLNSPWLEFQLPRWSRETIRPLVGWQARLAPHDRGPQLDLGFYSRAQREVADPDHPYEVNPAWRPEQTMPVHAGWLNAVLEGHGQVADGLDVREPVGVLLSKRSAIPVRWSEDLTRADSVLTVDDVAQAALGVGPSVTVMRIDGALHDVFLSRHDARVEAFFRMEEWVGGFMATETLRRAR